MSNNIALGDPFGEVSDTCLNQKEVIIGSIDVLIEGMKKSVEQDMSLCYIGGQGKALLYLVKSFNRDMTLKEVNDLRGAYDYLIECANKPEVRKAWDVEYLITHLGNCKNELIATLSDQDREIFYQNVSSVCEQDSGLEIIWT